MIFLPGVEKLVFQRYSIWVECCGKVETLSIRVFSVRNLQKCLLKNCDFQSPTFRHTMPLWTNVLQKMKQITSSYGLLTQEPGVISKAHSFPWNSEPSCRICLFLRNFDIAMEFL